MSRQQQILKKQQATQNKDHTQNKPSDIPLEQEKGIKRQNQQITVKQNNKCDKERKGTNNDIPTVMTERNKDKRPLEADTGATARARPDQTRLSVSKLRREN